MLDRLDDDLLEDLSVKDPDLAVGEGANRGCAQLIIEESDLAEAIPIFELLVFLTSLGCRRYAMSLWFLICII